MMQILTTIEGPTTFRRVGLLYGTPRTAYVLPKSSDCQIYSIQQQQFKAVLTAVNGQKVNEYISFLEKITAFKDLSRNGMEAVAKGLVEKTVEKDELLIQEGEDGLCLYLVIKRSFKPEVGGQEKATY